MPRKLVTHYFWMCVRVFVEEISIIMDAVDFSGGSVTKNRPAKAGDTDLISGLRRSHMLRANKSVRHNS